MSIARFVFCLLLAFGAQAAAPLRTVMVDTNGVVISPTNFWTANSVAGTYSGAAEILRGTNVYQYTTLPAAFAALQSGDTLTISPGTNTVTVTGGSDRGAPLIITNLLNVTVRGAGPGGCVIQGSGQGNLLKVAASQNIHIEGISFRGTVSDHNGGNVFYALLFLDGAWTNVSVVNCRFLDSGSHAIGDLYDSHTGAGLRVTGCRFENIGNWNHPTLESDGACVGAASSMVVANCTGRNVFRFVEIGGSAANDYITGAVITGNVVEDIGGEVEAGGGVVIDPKNGDPRWGEILITGNRFEGLGTGGLLGTGIQAWGGINVVASGNEIRNMPGTSAIRVQALYTDVLNWTVSGNTVDATDYRGIQLVATASYVVSNAVVSANTVNNCNDRGILVAGEKILVHGNLLNGLNGYGIQVQDTGESSEITVSGNQIYGAASAGIRVDSGVQGAVISGNVGKNNTGGNLSDAGTGTVLVFPFVDNPVVGSTNVVAALAGALKADGSVAMAADFNMGAHSITNLMALAHDLNWSESSTVSWGPDAPRFQYNENNISFSVTFSGTPLEGQCVDYVVLNASGSSTITVTLPVSPTVIMTPNQSATRQFTIPANTVATFRFFYSGSFYYLLGLDRRDVDASWLVGNLAVARFNSGSGASSTTFWRGDGVWAAPFGGSDTHVLWNDAGAATGEAAFTYNKTTDTLAVPNINTGTHTTTNLTLDASATVDLGGIASFEVPNGSAPTTDAFGEVAGDNDAWASGRGALQAYDGTAATYLVGALASDTPSSGQVPTFQSDGTVTWETPGGASSYDIGYDFLIQDEFVHYTGSASSLGWSATTGGTGPSTGAGSVAETNHLGVSLISGGTATGGGAILYLRMGGFNMGSGAGQMDWLIKTPVSLSDGTDNYHIGGGMMGTTGVSSTNIATCGSLGIWFYNHNTNGGRFQLITRTGGTGGTIYTGDSGLTVVAATWYLLSLKWNAAATELVLMTNGVAAVTNTSGLPTGTTYPWAPAIYMDRIASGGTDRQMKLDKFRMTQRFGARQY